VASASTQSEEDPFGAKGNLRGVRPRHAAARPYEILIPTGSNRNRNLTRLGVRKPARKEEAMLDFAFVALGFAVIALMGFYAMALRQL
jgi:hypothetical protein